MEEPPFVEAALKAAYFLLIFLQNLLNIH